MPDLEIYTDGSFAPKPRTGGVGIRIIFPNKTNRDIIPWGYKGATNNEMELQACILGLKEILKLKDIGEAESVVIYSDSQYVVSNIYSAKFIWPKRKWSLTTGGPVLNTSLWKDLIRAINGVYRKFGCTVYFEKVKAHSGIEGNVKADELAKKSRLVPYSNRLSITNVRRKLTKENIEIGSIRGEGQRVRIRVITSKWLSDHKEYRCTVEVISKQSKYYKKADYVISKQLMKEGHVYDVRLSSNLEYCRIEKVFREIPK